MGISTPALPGATVLADTRTGHDFWFHPNGLSARQIATTSNGSVWMICDQFHVYRGKPLVLHSNATPKCPVCSGRALVPGINDFATTHPIQAARFVHAGASGKTSDSTSARARAVATWRCDHGHEFVTSFEKMATEQRNHCQCSSHKRLNRGYSEVPPEP